MTETKRKYREQAPKTAANLQELFSHHKPVQVPVAGLAQEQLELLRLMSRDAAGVLFRMPEGHLRAMSISVRNGRNYLRSARGWAEFNRKEASKVGGGNPASSRQVHEEESDSEKIKKFRSKQELDLNEFHQMQANAFNDFLRNLHRAKEQKAREKAQAEQAAYRKQREETEARARQAAYEEQQRRQRVVQAARRPWWEVLGIPNSASFHDVKKAWKTAQFNNHPDRGGSHDAFIAVSTAWREAKAQYGIV